MKRILEIEGDVERLLHAVCDAALKNGGMAIIGHVNQLIGSIKNKQEECKQEFNERCQ